MQPFRDMRWQQPIPVPRIQIHDGTAYQNPSSAASAATQSSNSVSDIADQPFDFEVIGPQPISFPQFARPQLAFHASYEHQSSGNIAISSAGKPLQALSEVGSLHGSENFPHRNPSQAQHLDSHEDGSWLSVSYPWSSVRQQCRTSSYPHRHINDGNSSTTESDDFSIIESNCSQCLSKDDRLRHLETEMRELSHQVQEYKKTLESQHRQLELQERVISQFESQNPAPEPLQNRKRRHPAAEQQPNASKPLQRGRSANALVTLKRGRFRPEQRKQTAETRQKGACIKCWKNKQRCVPGDDPDGPCKKCTEMSFTMTRLPCIRTRIPELDIFRCGTGIHDTWTQRDEVGAPADLSTYISEQRQQLVLTHGFEPKLVVNVRRYRPVRTDTLEYVWTDGRGQVCSKVMPNYALSDIEHLKESIINYVDENQNAYINRFVHHRDVPTQKAFDVARRMSTNGKSILLHKVLQLWTAARLIEKPWQIHGDQTLGLEKDNHWWWIPITPMMDTQLDQVVIKTYLMPLKKEVLQMLQAKIEKACHENWLEIIVTIVILLNTVEEATRHDHEFATFFGHEYARNKRRFEDYKLIESYFHSALILLTHVKVAFEGRLPYLDAETNVSKLVSLCQNEVEEDFMIETDRYISAHRRKMEFEKIRNGHQYEAQQFWVHQLFLKEWDGKPISVKEIGEP